MNFHKFSISDVCGKSYVKDMLQSPPKFPIANITLKPACREGVFKINFCIISTYFKESMKTPVFIPRIYAEPVRFAFFNAPANDFNFMVRNVAPAYMFVNTCK